MNHIQFKLRGSGSRFNSHDEYTNARRGKADTGVEVRRTDMEGFQIPERSEATTAKTPATLRSNAAWSASEARRVYGSCPQGSCSSGDLSRKSRQSETITRGEPLGRGILSEVGETGTGTGEGRFSIVFDLSGRFRALPLLRVTSVQRFGFGVASLPTLLLAGWRAR